MVLISITVKQKHPTSVAHYHASLPTAPNPMAKILYNILYHTEHHYPTFIDFFDRKINELTNGRPSPVRAQLTPANFSRNTSATGDTRLIEGKSPTLHDGHLYPAGAVVGGS